MGDIMTIEQALESADNLIPNDLSIAKKISWLSELEGRLIDSHVKLAYTTDTPTSEVLIIPHPYDGIYISYLCAMIALAIGDLERYNSYLVKYNDDYAEYRKMRARSAKNNKKMYYGR